MKAGKKPRDTGKGAGEPASKRSREEDKDVLSCTGSINIGYSLHLSLSALQVLDDEPAGNITC